MPTYEYRCQQCNNRFEKFQSIKDQPLSQCPVCSGTLERVIGSGAGFIFKGSGFYITDHRSNSYKEGAKSETASVTTTSETKTQPTAESKTEPKKE